MNKKTGHRGFLLAFLLITSSCFCQVKLPYLVGNGMVLQREKHVNIWGWAAPGEQVTIQFRNKTYKLVTGKEGKWILSLPPMKPGGPFNMTIDASNHIELNQILIGDVWLCSGQSNMVLPMERVKEKYPDVIAQSKNDQIRQFFLPTKFDFNQAAENTPPAQWVAADPVTVLQFSATAYFFARALYNKYHVPIGLINSSVGGSPVEAWMSEDALKEFPSNLEEVTKLRDSSYMNGIRRQESATEMNWYRQIWMNDKGMQAEKKWYDPGFDASAWPVMNLPAFWADQGLHSNGVVWFRKEVFIPDSLAARPAKLFLGRIVDRDSVYVNGIFSGTTGYQYPPRRYELPQGVLKPGKNIIVVRVINSGGKGGFAPGKNYSIDWGSQSINLEGAWQYQLGTSASPLPPTTFFQYKPEGLYNSMIAPLLNYSIKGVIWYQGESNTGHPSGYRQLFMAMIKDWRQKWHEPSLPFLFVQLPNFGNPVLVPTESNWAELRNEQLKSLSLPHTAMAVTIDIGEWNDLHPLNKKDVGERLALAAENLAYGNKVVYSGPIYKSHKIVDGKFILSFSNIGGGLVAPNGNLKYFAIAGADKKFQWAMATIVGKQVYVWNTSIKNPVAVRYAWADDPEGADLYNKEGLPASPFTTEMP